MKFSEASTASIGKTTLSPIPSAPRSTAPSPPPPSNTTSSRALGNAVVESTGTAHQLEKVKIEETYKHQEIRRVLWECEFCDQTYNIENTFDRVYHIQGHQKDSLS